MYLKHIKVQSDYSPEMYMKIVCTDDGDVIFKIIGNGEMRIATSGGQFHGKKLNAVIAAANALVDALSLEVDLKKAHSLEGKINEASNCQDGQAPNTTQNDEPER